jgi:hypothetical protein
MSGEIFLMSVYIHWRTFWRVLRTGFVLLIFSFLFQYRCVAIRSGSLLEPVCLTSLSDSSCVDLPLLYDTLVQLLVNSDWEESFVPEQVNYLACAETNAPKFIFLRPY